MGKISHAKAEDLAAQWSELKLQEKELKETKEHVESELRRYFDDKDIQVLGTVMPYYRKGPAKFEKITARQEATLIDSLDEDYVKQKIDITKIQKDMANDGELRKLLRGQKLKIVQDEKLHFKHI